MTRRLSTINRWEFSERFVTIQTDPLPDLLLPASDCATIATKRTHAGNYYDTPGILGRSYPESEVQFRCLSAGDPELGRPIPQRVVTEQPTTIVAVPGLTPTAAAPAFTPIPPVQFHPMPPISTNRPGFNCMTNRVGDTVYTNCQ